MKDMVRLAVTLTITVLALALLATADVPQMINYQGRLTDSTGVSVPDGNYSVTFRIYEDSVTTDSLWGEGRLLTVKDGLFSVILGSIVPFSEGLFSDSNRWLGIQVGLDPEISPRTKLTSVAYAYHALRSDTAGFALSPGNGWVDDGAVVRLGAC